MGHLGERNVKLVEGMCTGINFAEPYRKNLCLCDTCVTTKMTAQPHNHRIKPGRFAMDLIHTDVVGPINIPGFDGSRYFVTFMCDYT
jgi:hypothetical protein